MKKPWKKLSVKQLHNKKVARNNRKPVVTNNCIELLFNKKWDKQNDN